MRGVAHRHERWARDAVDACRAKDERACRRTAKSCGPDAPTLATTGDDASHHAGMVARKPGSPGRSRRKPLKPFARGMPERFRRTCGDLLACFLYLHARLRV